MKILVQSSKAARFQIDPADMAPLRFHQSLPGYQVTPLVEAQTQAAAWGVAKVWIKDETLRLGLPSFKILGASWATFRALQRRFPESVGDCRTLEELKAGLSSRMRLTLVAATDGNHGRAVARVASWLGLMCRVFVPANTIEVRIKSIEDEGAAVTVVSSSYDDAVSAAAEAVDSESLLVSDTAESDADGTGRWVIDGYSTIFREVDTQLRQIAAAEPSVVVVQMGVGALAAAAIRHFKGGASTSPIMIGVEPTAAACVAAAVVAGARIVTIPGPHNSIMACLNAGRASGAALPLLSIGMDAFLTLDDAGIPSAMRSMASCGVSAGETGVAGWAALSSLLEDEWASRWRNCLGIDGSSVILVLATEGLTGAAGPTLAI